MTITSDLTVQNFDQVGGSASPPQLDQGETTIYTALAVHQRTEDWGMREFMAVLQAWGDKFNTQFKLDVPEFALRLDRLPVSRAGHFRPGHNGFGLKSEICINTRFMAASAQFWDVLGTLLHEMLHAWQFTHGQPSPGCHHNSEFRDKARELGLIVDKRGVQQYAAHGAFKDLLEEFGVPVSDEQIASGQKPPKGQSKLKKWSCGCTNVRVGKSQFRALCLDCNREFSLVGS